MLLALWMLFFRRQMVPMLQRTPENYKVSIFRLIDSDPEKINFNHVIKAFYMVSSDTYEDK